MRKVWLLPQDQLLINSGKGWLLNVLRNCTNTQRDCIIMLIWRIWQLYNDLTHDKEVSPVTTTVDFLESYVKSIQDAKRFSTKEIIKGKMRVDEWALPEVRIAPVPKTWPHPSIE